MKKRTRQQEIVRSEFKEYSIILSYYHYQPIIHYYTFSSNMVDIRSAKLLVLGNTRKIWNKIDLRFLLDLQLAMQIKEFQMSWKKNWTTSLKSTEKLTVSPNSFSIGYLIYCKLYFLDLSFLSILYVMQFCETRKINSNATRVLLLFQVSALNYVTWKLSFKEGGH